MNYQVPQFIEVEDKIFGPLTMKQFIYLAGGAGLSFIVYRFVTFTLLAYLIIALIIAFSLALAFVKINSKPFINLIESFFLYTVRKKLYLWRKVEGKPTVVKKDEVEELKEYAKLTVPKLSDSKLKDLAWSLNIHESMYTNKDQR